MIFPTKPDTYSFKKEINEKIKKKWEFYKKYCY